MLPGHQPPQQGRISPAAAAMRTTASTASVEDRFGALLDEARERIRQNMKPAQIEDPGDGDMATAEQILSPLVGNYTTQARRDGLPVTEENDAILRLLMDAIFGFGPLAPYLADPQVEEVICNGPGDIWIIHAERGKEKTGAAFRNPRELINFINRVAATGGRRLDRSSPKIDSRMRDGSRLHAVMEPLTVNVPVALTIRRHRLVARTIDDLVKLGTCSPLAGEFLKVAVTGRLNIVVAGGTASGKTNFLNALADSATDGDRFIIVEDTPELQIRKPDVIQMTTRERAEEARGFTIADLVVEALRMRPDRIITGEARGPEIVDVLMAANTGHDGQLLTVHANSTKDVIQRIETMYLTRQGSGGVPLLAIRRQIADAFQLVVFLKRVFVGKMQRRFVTEIAEIQPSQFMEADQVAVQAIFEDKGNGLAYTGNFPDRLAKRLEQNGVTLRQQFFTGR